MRMQKNPDSRETGYHSREHDEDPTCHATGPNDTPCVPVVTDAAQSWGSPEREGGKP